MSKIIIYDNKNILIADLERTETKKEPIDKLLQNKLAIAFETEYAAIFKDYKIIHSFSFKKQLRKIEKIFKYHKEGGRNAKKSI